MKQIAIRPLSPRETALLNECEETIAAGLTTFIEVGGALLTIHEGKLYRREFATFDEYCTAKWQIGRAYAYRLMEAVRTLLTLGDIGVPLPTNEAQARALGEVPEDRRVEVWEKAHEITDGQPTAAAVRAAAEDHRESAPGEAEPVRGVATEPGAAAGAGACDPAPAPNSPSEVQRPDPPAGTGESTENAGSSAAPDEPAPEHPVDATSVPGDPEPASPPAGKGEQGGPVTSPAGPPCEKCGAEILIGQADAGYMRCDDCDPEGDHVLDRDGCGRCRTHCPHCDQPLPT